MEELYGQTGWKDPLRGPSEEPWSASGPVRTALIWALLYLAPLLLVFLMPLAALTWLVRLWIRRRRKDGTEPH